MIDELVRGTYRQLLEQQEAWLRGLGIETVEDARLVAEKWQLEYEPIEVLADEGDTVKVRQTVRLVPRDTPR